MKTLKLALTLLIFNLTYSQTLISYSNNNDIIANPERGLQKYSSTNSSDISDLVNTFSYNQLNQNTLINWRNSNEKITIVYRYFILPSNDLSSVYLNNMQTDFNRIRNAGLKCIIRFAYTNDCNTGCDNGTNPQQPSKSQILNHITQLSNIVNNNKDIIFSIQCGFIGTYGEWYYTGSSEFGHKSNISSTQWQNRKDIINSMLFNFDENIPLQLRYANAKRQMYGNNIPTEFEQDRIGFYNDAFLNSYGDMGTYEVSNQFTNPVGTSDYNFIANTSRYLPMTGETNGLNPPRTDGSNAEYELRLLHFTTLNRDYYIQNWNNWISTNNYNNIINNLGYRISLKSGLFELSQDSLKVTLEYRNGGYSNILNKRKIYFVLKNTQTSIKYSFSLNEDCRYWFNDSEFTESINIENLPEGEYQTYLWLPDINLLDREEYSIQLANNNMWENGYNNLSYSFIKSNLGVQEIINYDEIIFDELYVYNILGQYISNDKELKYLPKGLYIIKGIKDNKIYTYKKFKPL